jgi:hypothetical protein
LIQKRKIVGIKTTGGNKIPFDALTTIDDNNVHIN